jgi:hypothetical protein
MKSRTYWVAFGENPTSEIDTTAMISPSETIVICVIKLLVRVSIGACPDLELDAVGILTVRDVQALVGKGLNGTACKSPFLSRAAVTGLEEEIQYFLRRFGSESTWRVTAAPSELDAAVIHWADDRPGSRRSCPK